MLHAFETPMTCIDNVDMTLGEAWLDTVTNNTMVLDETSFRAPAVSSSSAGKDTSTPGYYVGTGSERIFRGSFQMQSGMTTLTLEGWAQKGASESFQLFLNGVLMQTLTVPNGSTFTLTCSVTGLSAGQIGQVAVQISGTGYGGSGVATKYVIRDAYVSPAPSIGLTWTAAPTFAGTYNATLCNQVSNAQLYLAARLNAIPLLPFLASYYVHGSSVTGDVYPLWWGAVERANGANILNIRIIPMIMANVAEFYRVRVGSTGGVGGTIVHTGATMTLNEQRDDYLSLDLSGFSAGARLEAVIETVITTGVPKPGGDLNSRYHLWAVRMSNSAPGVAAAPYDFTADESLISTSTDTKLNALSGTLNAVKARLDANPRIFNRVPLMRRMYGRDDGQYAVYAPANTYAQRFIRTGSRLVVNGKNVRVAWGSLSTKAEKTTTTAYKVDFTHSQQLTDGDQYQTKTIYLDEIDGLRRGQAYSVVGDDVVYAAELLL